ncbi:O-acyltransferase [Campylobacterota bacterium]|nr:O-acyltransferase [Campylobacterota bacterium]
MTINSINFLLFFAAVFAIYYFALKEKTKAQNLLLLATSYLFYGIINIKMVPLLFAATLAFWLLGFAINKANESSEKRAFALTAFGVALGVGVLVYFKYFNWFIESFIDFSRAIGLEANIHTLDILVPIGVSFFTFKLISYAIEIHRRKFTPTTDFVAFATYIAFFPTIMAGPIDRPNGFLPQLAAKRQFDYALAVDGCRQILWGMFKKMVIADNLAAYIDASWSSIGDTTGANLLFVALLYPVQLYADFSGYSDMAIGTSKLLGFRVTRNFNYPFFGRNIAEFWRNWHMSLTGWLTDYVFMPLNIAFRNAGKLGTIVAVTITFVLIGLWHGASLAYGLFGLYHGLLYIPMILMGTMGKKRKYGTSVLGLPSLRDFAGMAMTFALVAFGMVIFRAGSVEVAWEFLRGAVSSPAGFFDSRRFDPLSGEHARVKIAVVLAIAMFIAEWYTRQFEYAIANLGFLRSGAARMALYFFLLLLVCLLRHTSETIFIYQQF